MPASGEKKTNRKFIAVSTIMFGMLLSILYLQFQLYNLGNKLNTVSENKQPDNIGLAGFDPFQDSHINFNSNKDPHLPNLARLSNSVCLLQGEYVFVDDGGTRICWRDVDNVIFAANSFENAGQNNQEISIQYTGSGFLVNDDGLVVTNKHVVMPWVDKKRDKKLINAGFKPKLIMFRAFFPGIKKPYDIEIVADSSSDDLAVVKLKGYTPETLDPLKLSYVSSGIDLGDTVVVLGYPTGFDLLSANISNIPSRLDYYDFAGLGQALSNSFMIRPMATKGICGQICTGRIAYDAPTAIGASGAPVLNCRGEVIAVNTALLKGFTGTNFGVPISKVRSLLSDCRQFNR